MDILSLIGLGVVVFTSTNIDDIFVLMMLFSSKSFSTTQVVLGQYLGIGILVAISVIGALVALVVPQSLIGLMGFLPIAIGIKKLFDLRKPNEPEGESEVNPASRYHLYLRFLTVAAVTFSNGGDNLGVYIPLFANSTFGDIVGLIIIFSLMVALWCAIAYYLVHHSFAGAYIRRIGNIILPFVLIGLGIYILSETFLVHT